MEQVKVFQGLMDHGASKVWSFKKIEVYFDVIKMVEQNVSIFQPNVAFRVDA